MGIGFDVFKDMFEDILQRLFCPSLSRASSSSPETNALSSSGDISISVGMMDGSCFTVSIHDAEVTESLHEVIELQTGCLVREQRLLFQGYILKKGKKLHEQGLSNDCALLLIRDIA